MKSHIVNVIGHTVEITSVDGHNRMRLVLKQGKSSSPDFKELPIEELLIEELKKAGIQIPAAGAIFITLKIN